MEKYNKEMCIYCNKYRIYNEDICINCHINKYPDKIHTGFIISKARERLLLNEIIRLIGIKLSIKLDKKINKNSLLKDLHYRPDFLCSLRTHSIIIEIDENSHLSYSKNNEEKRLLEIFENSKKPLTVIRFNNEKMFKIGSVEKTNIFYEKINKLVDTFIKYYNIYTNYGNKRFIVPRIEKLTVEYMFYPDYYIAFKSDKYRDKVDVIGCNSSN